MKTRRYYGREIYECERAPGEHHSKWVVQTYHVPTGLPWADEWCPHFISLRAARSSIREGRNDTAAQP